MFFFFFAGFNVETVEYKNISFTVWDVGGQDKVVSDFIMFASLFGNGLLIRFSVGEFRSCTNTLHFIS